MANRRFYATSRQPPSQRPSKSSSQMTDTTKGQQMNLMIRVGTPPRPSVEFPFQIGRDKKFGPRLLAFCQNLDAQSTGEWRFVFWSMASREGETAYDTGTRIHWDTTPADLESKGFADGSVIDVHTDEDELQDWVEQYHAQLLINEVIEEDKRNGKNVIKMAEMERDAAIDEARRWRERNKWSKKKLPHGLKELDEYEAEVNKWTSSTKEQRKHLKRRIVEMKKERQEEGRAGLWDGLGDSQESTYRSNDEARNENHDLMDDEGGDQQDVDYHGGEDETNGENEANGHDEVSELEVNEQDEVSGQEEVGGEEEASGQYEGGVEYESASQNNALEGDDDDLEKALRNALEDELQDQEMQDAYSGEPKVMPTRPTMEDNQQGEDIDVSSDEDDDIADLFGEDPED